MSSVANPSQLRQFLEQLNIKPRKDLSQNFLIDLNIVKKIVSSASIAENDSVLEIGPGAGALTEALVEAGVKLIAVEKDPILAKALSRFPSIQLFQEDFLKFSLENLPEGTKVVANLPYHLTTPMLTRILNQYPRITQVTVMVQKEVAERIKAKHATKAYGALSLFCQFFSDIESCFIVKNSCFYPRPKVDSAVVTFRLHEGLAQINHEHFFRFTRQLFSMRRKMLKASLKQLYQKDFADLLQSEGIDPTFRVEVLSLEEVITLFQCITNHCPADELGLTNPTCSLEF